MSHGLDQKMLGCDDAGFADIQAIALNAPLTDQFLRCLMIAS
jgi:hypothetical protein